MLSPACAKTWPNIASSDLTSDDPRARRMASSQSSSSASSSSDPPPPSPESGPHRTPPRRRSLRQTVSGQPIPPKDSATALLISGAAAGGVSKLLTAPIDRVKIMYQVSTSRPFTISSGMRTAADIVRTAGITALWRGNSIAVMRDVPYAAIMFSVRARQARTHACHFYFCKYSPL